MSALRHESGHGQPERVPHLYCVQYPDGWTSTPANLTRAKDAAYGHARYLLTQETPAEGVYSPETASQVRQVA